MSERDTGLIGHGPKQGTVLLLNPAQPAFRATNEAVTNVTGDSTLYTVVFATEVFDQASDFDGTSTFTAPVTGRYLLTATVQVSGMTNATVDDLVGQIVTSNDTFEVSYAPVDWGGSIFSHQIAIIADMDAADTAVVKVQHTGDTGGKVHDIAAGEAHFSGALLV